MLVTYESVSRTAGVSVAVHPVVSLPAPGPVPDDLTAGTDQHVLMSTHIQHLSVRFYLNFIINIVK